MRLKIRGARIFPCGGWLDATARNARAQWERREGLILRLEAESGIGVGEASPLPGYSPDTLAECWADLARIDWSRVSAPDPDAPEPVVEQLAAAIDPLGLRSPAARFAVETACLDLSGQVAGRSISALLRAAEGGPRRPIALSGLVEPRTRHGQDPWDRGIRTLKLKIGQPGDWERELLQIRALVSAFGPQLVLRLDANGSLSREQVEIALGALAGIRIAWLEEPTSLDVWRTLIAPPLVPLAADELLQSPQAEDALESLSAAGLCQAVVLKPMAIGGFGRALRLAKIAAARGHSITVTHCLDGPIALAAAAELALALPACAAAGLDTHAGLSAWPAWPIPQIAAATVEPGYHSGHGVRATGIP